MASNINRSWEMDAIVLFVDGGRDNSNKLFQHHPMGYLHRQIMDMSFVDEDEDSADQVSVMSDPIHQLTAMANSTRYLEESPEHTFPSQFEDIEIFKSDRIDETIKLLQHEEPTFSRIKPRSLRSVCEINLHFSLSSTLISAKLCHTNNQSSVYLPQSISSASPPTLRTVCETFGNEVQSLKPPYRRG